MRRWIKNIIMIVLFVSMIFINMWTIEKVNIDIYTRVYIQNDEFALDEYDASFRPVIDTTVSTGHCIIFIGEGLIMSGLFVYLIMSCFNKHSFRETFNKVSKIIIACILVVLLTSIITVTDVSIAEEYYIPWLEY